jgi:peptidoglycan/LPS O-acetylase OafA/YrhL
VIYSLEGLRGIAATLVALYHCWPSNIRNFSIILNGWLWVDLFFVLSGCVMAHAYDGKITNVQHLKSFFLKRLGRLYPLHLVTTGAFLLVIAVLPVIATGAKDILGFENSAASNSLLYSKAFWIKIVEQLPYHLTLTHGLNTVSPLMLNIPSWSISTEFAVYVLFAVFWLAAHPYPNLKISITLLLSIGSISYLFLYGGSANLGYMNDLGFWRCLGGFALGTFIPKVWFWLKSCNENKQAAISSSIQYLGLALALALFILANKHPHSTYLAPLVFFILVLGIGAKETIVTRFLSLKPMVTLGTLSYSIYLWHMPLLLFLKPVAALLPPWGREVLVLPYLLILIGIAKLSYKYIEAPWRDKAAMHAKRFASSSHAKVSVSH